jgi:hypothetical protein
MNEEATEVAQEVAQEDWFSRGKEDAMLGYSKQPPDDPEQASLYDLGYGEGSIQQPPTQVDDSSEQSLG